MKKQEIAHQLDTYQRAAIQNEDKACLVRANVGSGKTTVLTEKVRYLHDVKGIPYTDMAVLTFTNKAAGEIKERLKISEETPLFGTFHSAALYLLKNVLPLELLGYSKDFAVCTPEEELAMAKALIVEKELKVKYPNRLKKRLENAQNRLPDSTEDDLEKLVELLAQEKKQQNKMTFRQLLTGAILLLRQMKNIPKDNTMQYVLVDEVQDCDELQLKFIEALMDDDTRLFAVGDPSQVIYSWRGGSLNVFYLLKEKYGATELNLPLNYRSESGILKLARRFQQSGSPVESAEERKSLEACQWAGSSRLAGLSMPEEASDPADIVNTDPVTLQIHYDPFQEAEYLADAVKQLLAQGAVANEVAILYRLKEQSEVISKVFERENIPHHVTARSTLSDIPVLDWMVNVLKGSVNGKDRSSRILAMNDKTWVKQKGKSGKEEKEFLQQRMEKFPGFLDEMTMNTKTADETVMTERTFHPTTDFDPQQVYSYFELDRFLHPTANDYSINKDYVINLFEEIRRYVKPESKTAMAVPDIHNTAKAAAPDNPAPLSYSDRLADFLNHVALEGLVFLQQLQEDNSQGVQLMTLHASKGLEFTHVFLIGLNDGLLPLRGAGSDMDEEMRLFFVGATRAKKSLELSCYRNPGQVRVMPGEGQFLKMIPPTLLSRDADRAEGPAVSLTDLRRMVESAQSARTNVSINAGQQNMANENRIAETENMANENRIAETENMANENRIAETENMANVNRIAETENIANVNTITEPQNMSAEDTFAVQKNEPDENTFAVQENEPAEKVIAGSTQEGETAETPENKRVQHPRYGQGTVIHEDENMITVDFDSYGEKELMKLFSELTKL